MQRLKKRKQWKTNGRFGREEVLNLLVYLAISTILALQEKREINLYQKLSQSIFQMPISFPDFPFPFCGDGGWKTTPEIRHIFWHASPTRQKLGKFALFSVVVLLFSPCKCVPKYSANNYKRSYVFCTKRSKRWKSGEFVKSLPGNYLLWRRWNSTCTSPKG